MIRSNIEIAITISTIFILSRENFLAFSRDDNPCIRVFSTFYFTPEMIQNLESSKIIKIIPAKRKQDLFISPLTFYSEEKMSAVFASHFEKYNL